MNMLTKQKDNTGTAIIKVTRNGQITLPAEVRKMLAVKEGDYLEAGVIDGKIQLEPLTKTGHKEAWQRILTIVNRDKWVGTEPRPAPEMEEEQIYEMTRDFRTRNA
jgi:AbrB family looped-hinge helix DNA binding protein